MKQLGELKRQLFAARSEVSLAAPEEMFSARPRASALRPCLPKKRGSYWRRDPESNRARRICNP